MWFPLSLLFMSWKICSTENPHKASLLLSSSSYSIEQKPSLQNLIAFMCLKSLQLHYLALDRKDTVVFPDMKLLICQTIQVPQNLKIPSSAYCNLYPEIIISVLTKSTKRNKHKETKLKQDERSKITSGSLHQNQNVGLNLEINQKPAQLMKQRLKNIKGASRSVLCRLQTL